MATFPKIDQDELSLGQSQLITLLNDIIWRLCCLTQAIALDFANQPWGGESAGDCYIVGGTPTGSFSTFSTGDVAMYIGGSWVAVTPTEGWRFWVQNVQSSGDDRGLWLFNGASWELLIAASST